MMRQAATTIVVALGETTQTKDFAARGKFGRLLITAPALGGHTWSFELLDNGGFVLFTKTGLAESTTYQYAVSGGSDGDIQFLGQLFLYSELAAPVQVKITTSVVEAAARTFNVTLEFGEHNPCG